MGARVTWVDALKGSAIALVVLHHSVVVLDVLGVATTSWLRLDAVLSSVRMPVFFLASGLFARAWVRRSWPELLRGKVHLLLHVYVVWTLLLVAFYVLVPLPVGVTGVSDSGRDLVLNVVLPGTTLWFVYALAVFFCLTRALRQVPAPAQLAAAVALSVLLTSGWFELPPWTWVKMGTYYVFFLAGCHGRELVLGLAERASTWLVLPLGAVCLLTVREGVGPIATAPVLPLVAAAAAVAAAVLLSARVVGLPGGGLLAGLGRRTLQVYLLHTVFVVGLVAVLHPVFDSDAVRTLAPLLPPVVAAGAVGLSLLVHRLTRGVPGLYAPPRSRSTVAV